MDLLDFFFFPSLDAIPIFLLVSLQHFDANIGGSELFEQKCLEEVRVACIYLCPESDWF